MVSPFGNVPAGAGPFCAIAPLQVELLGCAVLHPLHRRMQTPIPVSQRLPLSSPVNTEIFLKSGALSTQQCSRGKTTWASTITSGLLPVATSFTGLISKGGGRTCNLLGASSSKHGTRALTGRERGGQMPVLGAAEGRGVCYAMTSSVPP